MQTQQYYQSGNGHTYVNVNLINNTPTIIETNLSYKSDSSFLNKPEDYHLAVASFSIASDGIPIFVFQDDRYYVTLEYNGLKYSQVVVWVRNDLIDPTYRDVYVYSEFLDCINTALSAAFTALKAANPGAPATTAPYMIFTPSANLFSIIAEDAGYNNATVGTVKIWFNQYLARFFPTSRQYYNGYGNADYRDVQMAIYNDHNRNLSGGLLTVTQESPSVGAWVDATRLVVVSNTLPITGEFVTLGANQQNQTQNATLKIVTDFIIPVNSNVDTNPQSSVRYEYTPSQYRLIDMTGAQPFSIIDLTVYWKGQDNTLHPIYITPGNSTSLKLLFIRKTPLAQNV